MTEPEWVGAPPNWPTDADGTQHWAGDGYTRSLKPDGQEQWCRAGQLHRENGPALTLTRGPFVWGWFLNGVRHRVDGPALLARDGTESWWMNGVLHRDGLPAVARVDGSREWWSYGAQVFPEE